MRGYPFDPSEDIGSFDFLSRRPSGFSIWFAYKSGKMLIGGQRSVLRESESMLLAASNTIPTVVIRCRKFKRPSIRPASLGSIRNAPCSSAVARIVVKRQFWLPFSCVCVINFRHCACSLRDGLASEAIRQSPDELDTDCVLLDTTGELQRWYDIATIVFIGKSLTAHGGQNPVEPIMAGKAVIFGPHMENFATLAKALRLKKGSIQVRDVDSLEQAIDELLHDSEVRRQLVQNAREVLSEHHGATARAAALVHELCSSEQQPSQVYSKNLREQVGSAGKQEK